MQAFTKPDFFSSLSNENYKFDQKFKDTITNLNQQEINTFGRTYIHFLLRILL